jgi:hypothetical protein
MFWSDFRFHRQFGNPSFGPRTSCRACAPTHAIAWKIGEQIFLATRSALLVGSLATLFAISAWGQVRIQAHPGMEVSEERVTLLFNVTCRVVAEEFRMRDASDIRVPVTLVLGESRDGVVGDETNQVFTIYMSRWDETMFATSVSRIALQHLLSRERKARIVGESLRRVHLVAPISADSLSISGQRHPPEPAPSLPRASLHPARPCLSSAASPFPEREDRAVARSSSFCPLADRFAP